MNVTAKTQPGPKCFLIHINYLETSLVLCNYVDDSALFEVLDRNGVSVIQQSDDVAARWTD